METLIYFTGIESKTVWLFFFCFPLPIVVSQNCSSATSFATFAPINTLTSHLCPNSFMIKSLINVNPPVGPASTPFINEIAFMGFFVAWKRVEFRIWAHIEWTNWCGRTKTRQVAFWMVERTSGSAMILWGRGILGRYLDEKIEKFTRHYQVIISFIGNDAFLHLSFMKWKWMHWMILTWHFHVWYW